MVGGKCSWSRSLRGSKFSDCWQELGHSPGFHLLGYRLLEIVTSGPGVLGTYCDQAGAVAYGPRPAPATVAGKEVNSFFLCFEFRLLEEEHSGLVPVCW